MANQKYRVYITGSNAKMLSREIATTLGGRFWNAAIYPYNFSEYLQAMGISLSKNWEYGKQSSEVSKQFNTYFQFGGFPELTGIVAKRMWLNDIYGKIFFSDLIVRNKVRATIIDFIKYLKESCLLFSIENYAAKFAERNSNQKYYFIDNGLLNIFLTDGNTSLLENIVAIHLYKQFGTQLFFYNQNIEVDFFLAEQRIGYQVSYSLKEESTYHREVDALIKLNTAFPLKQMYIITRDEEQIITTENGVMIDVVPIWKWLLTN